MSIQEIAANYRAATAEFLSLAQSIAPSDLDRSDAEGWTPRQVIHHVADSEAQSYARLRRLIAEPGTIIQGYDEGIWADNATLAYKDAPVESSIAVYAAVRESSYQLLLRLTEAQLDNKGTHSESGEYSVRDWIRSYTNHPTDHANQIRQQII
jgi:hypothetical protein